MYLLIGMKQWEDQKYSSYYNVGPDDCDCVDTGDLVTLFCDKWNTGDDLGVKAEWKSQVEANAPHEANFLKLDSAKIKAILGYQPRWHIDECMEKTVAFSKVYLTAPDKIPEEMDREIKEFFGE